MNLGAHSCSEEKKIGCTMKKISYGFNNGICNGE